MATLRIDLSGRTGLAKKFHGDVGDATGRPQMRYVGAEGQMAQGVFNPIRNYGFISPATNKFATVGENDGGANFTQIIRSTAYDSAGQFGWYAENGNILWRTNTSFVDLRGATGISQPMTGTDFKITDLEIYQLNGVRNLFFTYQELSGGNIGRIQYDDSTGVKDWLHGVATGGFYLGSLNDHFLVTSDNGLMYVGDGSFLHKIDGSTAGGANGTVTANVLQFPAYLSLVDGVDWRGYLWLAIQSSPTQFVPSSNVTSYNEQTVGVYVWDRSSTIVGTRDYIPIPGAREIRKLYVSPSGEMRAIVVSSERLIQIRRYNGVTFEVMEELGPLAYPTYRDSVTKMGGLTIWYAGDGFMYAHGSIVSGEKEALYVLGDTTGLPDSNYSTGAILAVDNNASTTTARSGIFFSNRSSTPTVYNRMWYPHGTGTISGTVMTGNAGNVYSLVKYLPKLSHVNFINIYCAPTAAGATTIGTVSVYLNQSTTAFKNQAITMDMASRGYVSFNLGKPYVNAVQLKVSWPTSTTLGSNDFCPAYAEIDYTPQPDNQ